MELTLNEYQRRAMTTCMASCDNHAYMLMGLVGEMGELFSKLAKAIRKEKIAMNNNDFNFQNLTDQEKHDLMSELGDIQWFIAGIAFSMFWDLQDIGESNLAKLASRKERGVIDGDGDNR